jgi:hypothetical protein
MKKSAKSEGRKKAAEPGQLWLHLPGLVREALYETVIGAGLACVAEALEAERVALCGARYEHVADRQALRAGHVASSLVLGGRRVAVRRPQAPALRRSPCRTALRGPWPASAATAVLAPRLSFRPYPWHSLSWRPPPSTQPDLLIGRGSPPLNSQQLSGHRRPRTGFRQFSSVLREDRHEGRR